MTLGLLFLKSPWILGYIVPNKFLFFLMFFFSIFHNTLMIYNTRNRSKDTTKSQNEKKTCFNTHFQYSQSKITRLNKMWSLKSLDIFKCESRTSLHAVQYKQPQGSILIFCSCYFKMASLNTLFLFLWDRKSGFVLSLILIFFQY